MILIFEHNKLSVFVKLILEINVLQKLIGNITQVNHSGTTSFIWSNWTWISQTEHNIVFLKKIFLIFKWFDDYMDSRGNWNKETCHNLPSDLCSILTSVKLETILGGDPGWYSDDKVNFYRERMIKAQWRVYWTKNPRYL